MDLVVRTEKDKRKFYLFLPIYKSFLFKLFYYNIKTDDVDIKRIEKALNIKSRKKRITYVYDEACSIVDSIFLDVKNPCCFKNNKCYIQRCKKLDKFNGCCRGCRYQSSNGCPTSNLACKLFFCSEIKKRYKIIEYKDLKILKVLSLRQRFLVKSDYFSKREDVIKDLFYGSIFVGTIRIVYRIIKNFIIVKKSVDFNLRG